MRGLAFRGRPVAHCGEGLWDKRRTRSISNVKFFFVDNSKLAQQSTRHLKCGEALNTSGSRRNSITCVQDQRPQWADSSTDHVPPLARIAVQTLKCHDTGRQQTIRSRVMAYLTLSKPHLSTLIVLSSMSAYALTSQSATVSQLLFLALGTACSSASANAINMAREKDYDALMTRTLNRPVVQKLISPSSAYIFSGVCGMAGVSTLYFGVNPTVAILGASNIALYGGLYTSLKRKSVVNTWVGAIVGAIPPLMGWAASSSLTDPGAWLLAGLLYAWQFPHFMAISHGIRQEYYKAGYVMAAWKNPQLNARVALRYSLAMFPICWGMCYFEITDWIFMADSSILNAWMTYWAFKFWLEHRHMEMSPPRFEGSSRGNVYGRKLFWVSVLQLPLILILAMLHKKGQFGKIKDTFYQQVVDKT